MRGIKIGLIWVYWSAWFIKCFKPDRKCNVCRAKDCSHRVAGFEIQLGRLKIFLVYRYTIQEGEQF